MTCDSSSTLDPSKIHSHEHPNHSSPSESLEDDDKFLLIDPTPAINIRARSNVAMELAIHDYQRKQKKPWTETVPEYLHNFPDVFTKQDFDELPPSRPWDHAIKLLPGTEERLDCKIYPLSMDEQKQLDEFLEEHLQTGRIRESKSPMASPFFFVKKKDGKLRPVQDYRKLNDLTIKNKYPLPLITELIDSLQNAKYFTKLDVRWGYNNVRIKEGDEFKAAFRTNRGLFEPLVMFFGLTNSPATFQTMMNDIFHIEIKQGHVLIYLDDILIFDNDLDTHHKHVRQVMERLREHKLYLKPEKCEFDQAEVEYLGVIVGNGKVRMDPVKIEGIKDWPTPNAKRDVQSFLGFCNFYRRFIHHYADIARPMNHLTGNVNFKWTTGCQEAFDKLKTHITSAPILTMANYDDQFRLETDASDFALGAVLSQKQDGKWKPVAYISKTLTQTERNYEIYDKELLAIITALEQFRHYLMGAAQKFEIWTDHANLQYFKKPQKLNRRQARWVTILQEYDFSLHHIPGKQNSKADILSRRPGFEKGVNDNDDQILLPESLFIRVVQIEPLDFVTRIKRSHKSQDKFVKENWKHSPEFKQVEDALLEYKGLVYVPIDKKLRGDIIHHHHDTRLAGHYGEFKTIGEITKNYWWPTIYRDVKKYVRGCETCQRTKSRRIPTKTPLHPFEPPTRPWEVITLDLIGPLPQSDGYDAILVVVDWLTKSIKFEATNMTLGSEGFAKILRDRVIRDHGLFRRIIHDRDTRFTSEYTKDLLKFLGIEQNVSTAYHPQTDGQTERMNQIVETYLRTFINYHQDNWKEWISLAEFSYNNSVHATTKQTPFFLNYGRHPWTGTDIVRHEYKSESAKQFAKRMKKVQEEAAIALKMANEKTKERWDKEARKPLEYSPGDMVYIEATHIKSTRPSRKLDDKRFGPFKILQKIGFASYKIELPPSWKGKHPVYNEMYLTPYRSPEYPRQKKPPPPPPIELEDGEKEYEIEEILDVRRLPTRKRGRPGKFKYLIHWKGWDNPEDHTWEHVDNLDNAKEMIKKYHEDHPEKPSPTNCIRTIQIRSIQTKPKQDERLFDPDSNTMGIGFTPPINNESKINIIIPFTQDAIKHFVQKPNHPLLRKLLPSFPPSTRRIWIYNVDFQEISYALDLNNQGLPTRMWQLLNPCTQKTMTGKYNCLMPQNITKAPQWLPRHYGNLQWIW